MIDRCRGPGCTQDAVCTLVVKPKDGSEEIRLRLCDDHIAELEERANGKFVDGKWIRLN